MDKIYFVLDKVTQFFSWLNKDVVLKSWHLQAIAAILVVMLFFILRRMRKNRIEKKHIIQKTGRSEIIGLKLSDHKTINDRIFHQQIQEQNFLSEQETHDKPWGQTTKEWRRLREQIRKLQHDITKNKRTEGQLKKEINELRNDNEQLKIKLFQYQQVKDDLDLQIKELTTVNQVQQNEINAIKNIKQFFEEQVTPEEINTEANPASDAAQSKQILTEKPVHTPIIDIESKNDLPPQNEPAENNPENIVKNQDIPLDIKELKSIADLVKKLQNGSQPKT